MKFYQRKEYEDLYCLLVMAVESSNCTHASENHKGKYVGQYCLKKKVDSSNIYKGLQGNHLHGANKIAIAFPCCLTIV